MGKRLNLLTMKRNLYFLLIVLAPLALGSCENEIEPGQTAVMKLSNEWWGQVYVTDGSGGLTPDDDIVGYQHLLTSSTASATADSLFVDDLDGEMELKAKVACNVNDLSFTTNGTSVLERYTDRTVTISNGRVFIGGGRSTSGVKVDSIYFEVEFSDELGTTYAVAGHGRTGFDADEH
jgi:hypothetical protein